ncbi:hypothetical protein BFU36_05425 [Sulfolobus sp. A20]|uniref:DUF1122 family protein n=1 Tax=Sulfolobaceae TaxID=118883 RepID=UPI000845F941|nr:MULTISPECIES: DUF1122 family protein [unclassified Sulfolobus]TRM75039.1 DUF1122 domain-containing protein [Sulfolobus sp. A20-N-F8]TRM78633.1 DUF1122 domain-containing protein [Sulfolobus sp. B5]TRM84616.1 DUF1122 domain-containing protein [Sulfolobus sp. F3]TRM92798.1 DUF1122 domain-containing protein [Sulfolobus sp. A20-N-G8]TRN01453.1 DUF1122 domain-containing protein [Sulfolobus sp. E1]TRN03141.1 DUF1122 domain-containing protein [Sulfolobus sp. F1]
MFNIDNLYLDKNLKLNVINVKRSHIKELITFDLMLGTQIIGRCNYFEGREYYTPWLEIDYYPVLRYMSEKLEVNLFKRIYNLLCPASKLFVTYIRDKETMEMLYKGQHPAETPLGFSILSAGFTWFKNWYFPEGGNEGFPKLQANKPLNLSDAIRQLTELKREVKSEKVRDKVEELIDHYRKSGDKLIQWEIT